MKPRVYPILHFATGVVSYTCDRTVRRFRSLAKGTLFIIGHDEDVVYEKSGPLEITCRYPGSDPRLGQSAEMNDNPWVEPLVEVVK